MAQTIGGYWLSDKALGATVRLVRTLFDGTQTEEWLPAALAAHEVLHSPQNGLTVKAARIDFGGVLDVWGLSFVPLNLEVAPLPVEVF
jgi:hypothetical protein